MAKTKTSKQLINELCDKFNQMVNDLNKVNKRVITEKMPDGTEKTTSFACENSAEQAKFNEIYKSRTAELDKIAEQLKGKNIDATEKVKSFYNDPIQLVGKMLNAKDLKDEFKNDITKTANHVETPNEAPVVKDNTTPVDTSETNSTVEPTTDAPKEDVADNPTEEQAEQPVESEPTEETVKEIAEASKEPVSTNKPTEDVNAKPVEETKPEEKPQEVKEETQEAKDSVVEEKSSESNSSNEQSNEKAEPISNDAKFSELGNGNKYVLVMDQFGICAFMEAKYDKQGDKIKLINEEKIKGGQNFTLERFDEYTYKCKDKGSDMELTVVPLDTKIGNSTFEKGLTHSSLEIRLDTIVSAIAKAEGINTINNLQDFKNYLQSKVISADEAGKNLRYDIAKNLDFNFDNYLRGRNERFKGKAEINGIKNNEILNAFSSNVARELSAFHYLANGKVNTYEEAVKEAKDDLVAKSNVDKFISSEIDANTQYNQNNDVYKKSSARQRVLGIALVAIGIHFFPFLAVGIFVLKHKAYKNEISLVKEAKEFEKSNAQLKVDFNNLLKAEQSLNDKLDSANKDKKDALKEISEAPNDKKEKLQNNFDKTFEKNKTNFKNANEKNINGFVNFEQKYSNALGINLENKNTQAEVRDAIKEKIGNHAYFHYEQTKPKLESVKNKKGEIEKLKNEIKQLSADKDKNKNEITEKKDALKKLEKEVKGLEKEIKKDTRSDKMAENLKNFDKLCELRDSNAEKLNEYLTEQPVEKSEKEGDAVGIGVVGADTDDSSKDDNADEQKADEDEAKPVEDEPADEENNKPDENPTEDANAKPEDESAEESAEELKGDDEANPEEPAEPQAQQAEQPKDDKPAEEPTEASSEEPTSKSDSTDEVRSFEAKNDREVSQDSKDVEKRFKNGFNRMLNRAEHLDKCPTALPEIKVDKASGEVGVTVNQDDKTASESYNAQKDTAKFSIGNVSLEVQGTDGRGQSIGSENLYSTMNSAETSGALTRADSQADIQTIVLIDALNAKVNEGESGNKSGIGIFKAGEKGLEFSLNDTAKKKLSPDKIGEIMAFLQAVKENTSVGTEAKEVAEAIETGIATEYGLEIERDDDAIEDTQTDFENQFDDGVNDSYEPDDDGSNDFANSLADYDED